MAFPGRDPICSDFCLALGLDPHMTRKIVLTMEPDNVVTFEAQIFAEKDGVRSISEIITRRCRIVPLEGPVVAVDSTHIEYPREAE